MRKNTHTEPIAIEDEGPPLSPEAKSKLKRLLIFQIVFTSIASVLALAMIGSADFMPLMRFAHTGEDVVRFAILTFELALYGSTFMLMILWAGNMYLLVSFSRIEQPTGKLAKNAAIVVSAFLAAVVLILVLALGDLFTPAVVFLIASCFFLLPVCGFGARVRAMRPRRRVTWLGNVSFPMRKLAIGGTYLFISTVIFFLPLLGGRPMIRGFREDLAAIERGWPAFSGLMHYGRGGLVSGVLTISAEDMANGFEYQKEAFWNWDGYSGLHGYRGMYVFPNNPVNDYSMHGLILDRLAQFPPSLSPSALLDLLPEAAHERGRTYQFDVTVAHYSRIVIDVVPRLSSAIAFDETTAIIGANVEFGGIEWRVLDLRDGKALLLSEHILERRRFHEGGRGGVPITWEASNMRSYLNTEMYNSFSPDERARIAQSVNENKYHPWFRPLGDFEEREDTVDKIFLLSLDEVLRYFGDSGMIDGPPQYGYWIDDEYNEARLAENAVQVARSNDDGVWWLRNAYNGDGVNLVSRDGKITGGKMGSNWGVRPAMWVFLQQSPQH